MLVWEGYDKDEIKSGAFQLVLFSVDRVNSKQTRTNPSVTCFGGRGRWTEIELLKGYFPPKMKML